MKIRRFAQWTGLTLALLAAGFWFAPSASAHPQVHVGIGVYAPGVTISAGNCWRCGYGFGWPVYYAPAYNAPIYYAPAYYRPVYRAPVYYPAPVYYVPRRAHYGYRYYAPRYHRYYQRPRYYRGHAGWHHYRHGHGRGHARHGHGRGHARHGHR